MYQTELEALNAINDKLDIFLESGLFDSPNTMLETVLNMNNYISYLQWIVAILVIYFVMKVVFDK